MAKGKHNKEQHFVPQSYLKAWCDKTCPVGYEPYVWLFEKDGGNPRPKAPANIFHENEMYTIRKDGGERDTRIEGMLSKIEDRFVKIRNRKLSAQEPLTTEEFAHLCFFVSVAQFRTPSSRDHWRAQWSHLVTVADDIGAAMKSATPEERRQYSRTPSIGKYGRSLSHAQVRKAAESPLQTMMHGVMRAVAPILSKMNLAIFVTNDPIGFITTDEPCIWHDPESYKRAPGYRHFGLGCRTIEITMPISPQQCLLFSWQDVKGYRSASQAVIDELNCRHIVHCTRHFISQTKETKSCWFEATEVLDDYWET